MLKTITSLDNIHDELNEVKIIMKANITSGDQYLDGSLDYLMAAGGKMLRPSLLLIGSKLGRQYNQKKDQVIKLAAAIETIHLATLIHDDIIDQSTLRRGSLSIQAKYGQSYAVYMGDYLLSKCFLMLTHLDLEKEQAIRIAKVFKQICVGDMKQYQKRYNIDIRPYHYLMSISGKTSALISVALSAGAYTTNAKKSQIKLLARIGHELGMAFQLVDDLLDYEGESALVGKDLQVDISRGYYSMPIIYALQAENEYSSSLRNLLSKDLTASDLDKVYEIIKKSGTLEMTRALATRYNDRAMRLINELPDGETKKDLVDLIPYLLNRNS